MNLVTYQWQQCCKSQLNDSNKTADYKELNKLPKGFDKATLFLCGVIDTAEGDFFFSSAIIFTPLIMNDFLRRNHYINNTVCLQQFFGRHIIIDMYIRH